MVPREDLRAQEHESSRRRRCGGEKEGRAPLLPLFFSPLPPTGSHTVPPVFSSPFPPALALPLWGERRRGKKGGGKERRTTFLHVLGGGGETRWGREEEGVGFAFLPSSPPPSSGFTGFPEILLHFSCYTRYRSTFFVSFSFVPPFLRIMKKKHRRAGRKAFLHVGREAR